MLDVIKSIINRKRSFLEAANLILEDMENDEIMDSLLDDKLTDDGSDSLDSDSSSTDDGFDTIGDDSGDLSFGDDSEGESIADDGIDDSMMIKDSDEESSPDDEISDIFAISIDTRTNTVRDILPVPPMNAADAVVGDSDAKLDSGFGAESGDMNPMDDFFDESSGVFYRGEVGHRFLFEGIDDGSGDSSSSNAPDMGSGNDVPDAPSPDTGEESEVTTAVKQDLEEKDKESEEGDTIGDDTGSDDLGDDLSSSEDSSSSSSGGTETNADRKEKIKILDDAIKKISDVKSKLFDDIQ